MMTNFAQQVIDTLKAPEFTGDLVLAYLWNRAGQHLGLPNVPSHHGEVAEETVKADARVVLARRQYANSPSLQALLAAA